MPKNKADTIKSKATLLLLDESIKALPNPLYWDISVVQRSLAARIGDILAIKLHGDIDSQGYWRFKPQKQKRKRSVEVVQRRARELKAKSKEKHKNKRKRKAWLKEQLRKLNAPLPERVITRRFPAHAREIIRRRQSLAMPGQVYLFPSTQASKVHRPLTRQAYHNNLKKAASSINIRENVASHTMRKSTAYQAWIQTGGDAAAVGDLLYQVGVDSVKPYIGVSEDETDRLSEAVSW